MTCPGSLSWKLGQGPDFSICSLPGIRVIIQNWQAWGLGEWEPHVHHGLRAQAPSVSAIM